MKDQPPASSPPGTPIPPLSQSGDSEASATNAERKRKDSLKTIAGVAGNVLEWYDFAVFGYLSDIIGEVFFPPQSGNRAIMESFIVFGVAFFVRPLGAILIGRIGDRFGRKLALEVSIFLMAGPTLAMGLLPSYESVGWASTVLLTIVRLFQGLSVGGQLTSSLVFTLENHPRKHWGLYSSVTLGAASIGSLLGGLVSFLLRAYLSDAELRDWGWRIPFLVGTLVCIPGIYLKFFCDEDDDGLSEEERRRKTPIRDSFRRGNRRSLLAATLVSLTSSMMYYVSLVWMAIFMEAIREPPVPHATGLNTAAMVVNGIFYVLAGWLSDKHGRYQMMMFTGVLMIILNPLMIDAIATADPLGVFLAQSVLAILTACWAAPMFAWMVGSFERNVRLTSVSISFNAAHVLGGGLSPAFATFLVEKIDVRGPGLMLSAVAALGLLGLCIAPRRSDEDEAMLDEALLITNHAERLGDGSPRAADEYALHEKCESTEGNALAQPLLL